MEIDINLSEVQDADYRVQLLLKFLRQNITPDELQQLNTWVAAHPSHKEVFDRLHDETQLLRDLQLLKQVNVEDWWQTIARQGAFIKPVPFYRRWYTSVAAVVLLLVVILFSGRYFHHAALQKSINENATGALVNRPPGGNKATLTLSNGLVIDLDNTAKGTIAEEGSAKVVKPIEGQLQYITGNNSNPNTWNILATPRGGQYQLVLPDGSKVWLNAASSIRYPTAFTGNERRVQVSGEVYFEVAPSVSPGRAFGKPSATEGGGGKRIPFIVDILPPPGGRGTGSLVEVLGTHFNINAYSDEEAIKTTLLEGKVKVSTLGLSEDQSAKLNLKNYKPQTTNYKLLAPGQQASIQTTSTGDSIAIEPADTDVAIAWKKGYSAFKNADIKTIMRMLGRWYNVEVNYEGNIPDSKFTGAIPRSADLSTVLHMLQYAGIHLKTRGEKIIVIP